MSPGSLFDFIILLSFSVTIINGDTTSHCDDTLFAIVGGDPQLLALLRRCTFVVGDPLINCVCNFALIYYRGRCPLTNCIIILHLCTIVGGVP